MAPCPPIVPSLRLEFPRSGGPGYLLPGWPKATGSDNQLSSICRMKRFLFSLCLLLAAILPIRAHPYVPPSAYLPSSDQIYLVRVSSAKADKITFSVTETLKGSPCASLTLIPVDGFYFHEGTEWILIHLGRDQWKDHVGELLSGDCEWLPAAVSRKGDTAYIQTGAFPNSGMVLDTLPDGTKGLTLDHIKQLLNEKPSKG